jgi:hypothetical protein
MRTELNDVTEATERDRLRVIDRRGSRALEGSIPSPRRSVKLPPGRERRIAPAPREANRGTLMSTSGEPGVRGSSLQSHVNGNESMTDRIGLGRLAPWMSRSFGSMLADLTLVDCGSLDVLLYCADDLAASTPGDVEVDRPR